MATTDKEIRDLKDAALLLARAVLELCKGIEGEDVARVAKSAKNLAARAQIVLQ